MTRREEIVTATLGCRQNYVDLKRPITPDDVADAFVVAAQWADKTMIDKASEWLKEQDMNKYLRLSAGMICVTIFDKELFIKDFLKAMEE